MVEVWCACVTTLSLGTKVEIIMVWFYCTTFLAASGVARYQERLDIDVFLAFLFLFICPRHIHYTNTSLLSIDKHSPHGKLLFKSGVFIFEKGSAC